MNAVKKFLGHLSSSKPMTFKACRCFRKIAERCSELIWLIVDSEIDMPSHIKIMNTTVWKLDWSLCKGNKNDVNWRTLCTYVSHNLPPFTDIELSRDRLIRIQSVSIQFKQWSNQLGVGGKRAMSISLTFCQTIRDWRCKTLCRDWEKVRNAARFCKGAGPPWLSSLEIKGGLWWIIKENYPMADNQPLCIVLRESYNGSFPCIICSLL